MFVDKSSLVEVAFVVVVVVITNEFEYELVLKDAIEMAIPFSAAVTIKQNMAKKFNTIEKTKQPYDLLIAE